MYDVPGTEEKQKHQQKTALGKSSISAPMALGLPFYCIIYDL